MIGASKILTVSYGTFSCTLEGFDDPFNTMRAIAEYFRDLAAEDRYFGAEPPTPDAAMLLKIAEREVQRRVEAKIQENGVVLRTGDAMEAPRPVSAPQPKAPVVQPSMAQTPRAAAPFSEPAAAPSPAPMPDGVAAKLLRIRAAVTNAELAATRAEQPAAFTPAAPILADYTEDQHADDFDSADAFAATIEDQPFDAEIVDAEVWDERQDALPESLLPEPVLPEPVLPEPPLPEPTLTEVAADADTDSAVFDSAESDAMLGRIAELADEPATPTEPLPELDTAALADRLNDAPPAPSVADTAPTAQSDDAADLANLVSVFTEAEEASEADLGSAAPEDLLPEDLLPEDLLPEDLAPKDLIADDRFGDALAAEERAEVDLADDDLADEEMADADYAISAEDLADLRELETDAHHAAPLRPAAPAAEVYDEDYETGPQTAVAATKDAESENAFADLEDIAEQTTEVAVDPVLEEIDSAYAPQDEPVRGPSDKVLRARARVLKVRRDDAVSAEATAEVAAMLAADAADDLSFGLRALQIDTDTPNPNDVDDEAGSEDDARKRLDAAGEAAVSRLIEQTNEVMAVPENRRRLSAIAHLKAAVAATVADRFSKGSRAPKEADTTRLDPYRDDLARVVRPQTPEISEDNPVIPRPAPLVLVSAQRIDRPRTAPGGSTTPLASVPNSPIRPRRVTSAQVSLEPTLEIEDEEDEIDTATIFVNTRGFAEFSERLGASSLAEILEAAAAYSVCVEGRPYFSRPQLMGQIGALSADSEYTREDGLRTFGTLLRDGRIQKVKRGQFVLTESSHYLAEARRMRG